MLTAGYAQSVITPALERPVYLAGYRSNKPAERIHDDLWARVLALRLGEQCVILAALDLIGLARSHCLAIEAAVRQRSGQPVELLIACSHTHFGPDTIGLWGPSPTESGVDPLYLQFLTQTVTQTCLRALQAATQPVQVRSAAGDVLGVARNNRDPHITDEEATFVQFVTGTGAALATLVIYPCHPEGVDFESTDITCDYVHGLRQRLEAHFGGAALFMPGALGGMMSPDLPEPTHAAAQRMGEIIAEYGIQHLPAAPLHPVARLSFTRQAVHIPLQNVLFDLAAQAGLLPDITDAAHDITTETGIITVGDVQLATIPGELLPRPGKEIKARLKAAGAATAAVICLANDEIGYILPQEDFIFPQDWTNPGRQYEESMSIGPETAPRLLQALERLLTG
ncbi:MAG: hypothetical protein MUE40_05225 [Anaerolineae bacterium]|jgi:hypothetical protein|nr:hypothetical protein [Anaerolineae bacterium]